MVLGTKTVDGRFPQPNRPVTKVTRRFGSQVLFSTIGTALSKLLFLRCDPSFDLLFKFCVGLHQIHGERRAVEGIRLVTQEMPGTDDENKLTNRNL